MAFREHEVAVSAKTHWCLQRIAAAMRESESPMDTPTTADSLADQVLSKHLEAYPALLDMFNQREKINKDALAAVAEALKGTQCKTD